MGDRPGGWGCALPLPHVAISQREGGESAARLESKSEQSHDLCANWARRADRSEKRQQKTGYVLTTWLLLLANPSRPKD